MSTALVYMKVRDALSINPFLTALGSTVSNRLLCARIPKQALVFTN